MTVRQALKLERLIVPSHIALSCSGVFAEGRGSTAEADSLSVKAGFVSSPTLLGIRAVPSVMAEKFMPMNRSIMSCVACSWSYPAICDALKICESWYLARFKKSRLDKYLHICQIPRRNPRPSGGVINTPSLSFHFLSKTINHVCAQKKKVRCVLRAQYLHSKSEIG